MSEEHTASLEAFLKVARAQDGSIVWRENLIGHLRNTGLNLTPLFSHVGAGAYLDADSVNRYIKNMSSTKSRLFILLKGAGLDLGGQEKDFEKRVDGCLLLFQSVLRNLKGPISISKAEKDFDRVVNITLNSIIEISLAHYGLTNKAVDQIWTADPFEEVKPIAADICGKIPLSHIKLCESLANEIADVMDIDDSNWRLLNNRNNRELFAQSVFKILHLHGAIAPESRETLKKNLKTEVLGLAIQFKNLAVIDPEDVDTIMHNFSWQIVDVYYSGNLPHPPVQTPDNHP